MTAMRLVILGGDRETTGIVYHFLAKRFPVAGVIIENPVPRLTFLKRRIRKCGLMSVIGQVIFAIVVAPFLEREARERKASICRLYEFSTQAIPAPLVKRVFSVNDPAVMEQITAFDPTHVVVWGTRIIGRSLLEAVAVPMINIHSGITPMYRGSHGGYWALHQGDAANCGVTVHLIDAGVDTGLVLAQKRIRPEPGDNFATYPFMQLGEGLRCLEAILGSKAVAGVEVPEGGSRIWYHPTVWGYLASRLLRGIR